MRLLWWHFRLQCQWRLRSPFVHHSFNFGSVTLNLDSMTSGGASTEIVVLFDEVAAQGNFLLISVQVLVFKIPTASYHTSTEHLLVTPAQAVHHKNDPTLLYFQQTRILGNYR